CLLGSPKIIVNPLQEVTIIEGSGGLEEAEALCVIRCLLPGDIEALILDDVEPRGAHQAISPLALFQMAPLFPPEECPKVRQCREKGVGGIRIWPQVHLELLRSDPVWMHREEGEEEPVIDALGP